MKNNLKLIHKMYSVQIIVISITEERKQRLIQQFKEIQLPFPVYFLEASTPENSKSYLPENDTFSEKRILCCTRSHIRAIEYASRDTSSDVSIVLEDDVALDKDNFIPTVLNLLEHWNTIIPKQAHMVTLGWVPQKSYEEYDNSPCKIHQNGLKILEWFVFGLQAYAIKKTSAKLFIPIIYKDTWLELKDSVHRHRTVNIAEDDPIRIADVWLNKFLIQVLAFPMVVIEQRIQSTLRDSAVGNAFNYDYYFKNCKDKQKKFWSHE